MDNFDKSFEELLRERLENHEYAYDASQWAKMQDKLAQQQQRRPWLRFRQWGVRLSAAALAAVLLMSAGWYLREATLDDTATHQGLASASAGNHNAASQTAIQSPSKTNNPTDHSSYSAVNPGTGSRNTYSNSSNGENTSGNYSTASLNTTGNLNAGASKGAGKSVSASKGGIAVFHKKKAKANAEGNTAFSGSRSGAEPAPVFTASADKAPVALVSQRIVLAEDQSEHAIKAVTASRKESRRPLDRSHYKKSLALSIVGGLNIDPSNGGVMDVSPAMGVVSTFSVSPKLSLETGAMIDAQGGKNISYCTVNVQYGLSRDSSITVADLNKLVFFKLPINLKYKLNDHMNIFSGVQISTPLSSTVSMQQKSYNGESLNSFQVKLVQIGQVPGIKRLDISIPLGFEFNITPKMSLAAAYQFGLTDISKNDYFNNTLRHTTTVGQFVLRYHI